MEKLCGICMENKPIEQIFNKLKCSHTFCSNCIRKYVVENVTVPVTITVVPCPDSSCNKTTRVDVFQEMFLRKKCHQDVMVDELISCCTAFFSNPSLFPPGTKRVYCPRCLGLMVLDDAGGDQVVKETDCWHCGEVFCEQCFVPWHSGMNCQEFCRREGWIVKEEARPVSRETQEEDE